MPELAATGADFVSVGALTHSAPAVDISFEIEPILSRCVLPTRRPSARRLADAFAAASARFGRLGRRLEFFPTIGSTNDVASRLRRAAACRRRRRGRGRRRPPDADGADDTWFSPPGAGLYVSVDPRPGLTRARAANGRRRCSTLAAGVALVDGVDAATGLDAVD